MKTNSLRGWAKAVLALTLGIVVLLPTPKTATAATPFEQAAYLYNTSYDTNLTGSAGAGTGKWGLYRSWLGVANLGAEADPGWGPGDWYDCCQHLSWNKPWGTMQQRYGANLPTVILGMGQMPWDPNTKGLCRVSYQKAYSG